jgi:sensor histidine kinase YesM
LQNYKQEREQVISLLGSLTEEFRKDEKTQMYFRIVMQLIEEQHRRIQLYASYNSTSGSFSADYVQIGLVRDYVSEFLTDLLSAYLDQINRINSQTLAQFKARQNFSNFFVLFSLLLIAAILEFFLRRTKRKMFEVSYVMTEIGKRNFEVADISLTNYSDANELISTTNKMKEEIQDLILQTEAFLHQRIEHEQQKRLLAESQIKELQLQINPHFLFNTLSMIIRHIQRDEKEISVQLVKQTSLLLRSNLQKNQLTISLDEELELLRSYVFIQQLHLQGRAEIVMDIRRGYSNTVFHTPPFVIQPIVENAVLHGLKDVQSGGLIEIQVTERAEYIEVRVTDNGIGMNHSSIDSILTENDEHVGLTNVYQRLRLFYQREDVLTIQSKPGKGTEVDIKLYKKEEQSCIL